MIEQRDVNNGLLSSLPPKDFKLIQPHLHWADMIINQTIQLPNETIQRAIFPVSGICSVFAVTRNAQIETGIIGREGFVGIPVILGATQAPYKVVVQGTGKAVAISATRLRKAMKESQRLIACLLRFTHVFQVQMSQTALSNGSLTIERRLARWLLMCQDRLNVSEFALTHEFLANMLAVRRSGVTVALQKLEGEKIIKALRGKIEIVNRKALLVLADSAYGVPETEYSRLIG